MYKRFAAAACSLLITGVFAVPALAGDNEAILEEGKALFNNSTPACAVCHTLKDADATGNIGPDLDELQPAADRIKKAMIEGTGPMPSFSSSLSDDEMDAIAAYITSVAGK